MSLRHRLAAIFSPTRRLLGADDVAPIHVGGILGGVEYLVPRARCHYKRFDFSALPAKQRMSAAGLAASRLAPTASARVHVGWQSGVAHVWICPDPPPEMAGPDVPWIPETRLRPLPWQDGARLLAMVDGFEGQVWEDGRLHASRWWATQPDDADWSRFLRAAGLTPALDGSPRVAETLGFDRAPWGDARVGLPGSPAAFERVAWRAVLGLLAIALGWQLMGQASWRIAGAVLQADLEAVRSQATPLMEARERAERAAEAVGQLVDLQQSESDYRLMPEVLAPLPADAVLASWVRDGGRLQVALTSAERDPRRYVSAFESHPRLSDLSAAPVDQGGMRLEFNLASPPAEAPR